MLWKAALRTLQNLLPKKRLLYFSLVEALILKLEENHLASLRYTQLKSKVQQSKEDLTAFAIEIERLLNAAILDKNFTQFENL